MADKTINLDDIGSTGWEVIDLSAIEDGLLKCAVIFIDVLQKHMDAKDVSSSGYLQDNINHTNVEINGSNYKVDILAPEYFRYQDEGVDGFKKSRGSRFKFKNGGTPPEMVEKIKQWLSREKKSNTKYEKYATSKREIRAKNIQSLELKAAKQAAYMIKRQGIEGKKFTNPAINEMNVIIENELGQALQLTILTAFDK